MKLSVLFLLAAIGSALLGFGELLDGSAFAAKAICAVFILLFFMALFKESPSSKSAVRTNYRDRY